VSSPKRNGEQTLLQKETLGQIERFSEFQLEQDFIPRLVQAQIRQGGTFHRYLILKRLTPDEMTPERLKEYLSFVSFLTEVLHGRRLSESTRLGWRVTLRHYYRWLKAQGLVAEDPARRVGTKG
jgi:site-specific recombinase XerD